MEMPAFKRWTRWTDRFGIDGCNQPGVYLLGRFESTPPEMVDPISQPVIYIGETCNQTLAKRWYQFGRSAFERKFGHSGGSTFSDQFCGSTTIDPPVWLYIAALPVFLDEPHRSAYIRFIERWLIWMYVQKFNTMPVCNSK